jgi:hypothetical protein
MRIAFYFLSALLIIGMAFGLYYIITSRMDRHRGWQRSAAVVYVVPALPSETGQAAASKRLSGRCPRLLPLAGAPQHVVPA